jgi:hypothetical protein
MLAEKINQHTYTRGSTDVVGVPSEIHRMKQEHKKVSHELAQLSRRKFIPQIGLGNTYPLCVAS